MTINPVKIVKTRINENREFARNRAILNLKFENQMITYRMMDEASRQQKLMRELAN
jgi:hypothetical protein